MKRKKKNRKKRKKRPLSERAPTSYLSKTKWSIGAVLLLFLFSLFLNVLGSNWGGGNPDENYCVAAHIKYPQKSMGNRFYPTFYMYMLRVFIIEGARSLYPGRSNIIYERWGRRMTAILGALSCVFVFFIGRNLLNTTCGFIASLILASSPIFSNLSHYMTVDIPAVFWITAGLCLLSFLRPNSKIPLFALLGAIFGLSTATKYTALLSLFAPFVLILRWLFLKSISPLRALTISLTIIFTFIVFFILGNPIVVANPPEFIRQLRIIATEQRVLAGRNLPLGYRIIPVNLSKAFVIPPFIFVFILLTSLFLLFRHRSVSKDIRLWIVALLIVQYLAMGNSRFNPLRYSLPFLPIVALVITSGGLYLFSFIREKVGQPAFLVFLLFLLMIVNSTWQSLANDFALMRDPRMQAEVFFFRHIPRGINVACLKHMKWTYPRLELLGYHLIDLRPILHSSEDVVSELKRRNVPCILYSDFSLWEANAKEKEFYQKLRKKLIPEYALMASFKPVGFLGRAPRYAEYVLQKIEIYALLKRRP